jgi:O-methyltransferase involved in polyketide biosynthesis
MAQVRNVSGTAFVVAESRAEENDETYPLYRDPIVKLFLSEESRQAADRIAAGFSAGKRDGQDQNPVLR